MGCLGEEEVRQLSVDHVQILDHGQAVSGHVVMVTPRLSPPHPAPGPPEHMEVPDGLSVGATYEFESFEARTEHIGMEVGVDAETIALMAKVSDLVANLHDDTPSPLASSSELISFTIAALVSFVLVLRCRGTLISRNEPGLYGYGLSKYEMAGVLARDDEASDEDTAAPISFCARQPTRVEPHVTSVHAALDRAAMFEQVSPRMDASGLPFPRNAISDAERAVQSCNGFGGGRHVVLHRHWGEGFGLGFAPPPPPTHCNARVDEMDGLLVSAIVAGSPAERCAQISVGDRVFALNGQLVDSHTNLSWLLPPDLTTCSVDFAPVGCCGGCSCGMTATQTGYPHPAEAGDRAKTCGEDLGLADVPVSPRTSRSISSSSWNGQQSVADRWGERRILAGRGLDLDHAPHSQYQPQHLHQSGLDHVGRGRGRVAQLVAQLQS